MFDMPLSIKLKPSQSLSPATVQLMNILQMNELELQVHIQKIFEENPMFELNDCCPAQRIGTGLASLDAIGSTAEAPDVLSSLRHDVALQVSACRAPREVKQAAMHLAGWLDENAFLTPDDFAAFRAAVGTVLADAALTLLQGLSPAGIAARSLSECLQLQLRALPDDTALAQTIAGTYLEHMAKGHFLRISELTGESVTAVKKACEMIRELDPKPYKTAGKSSPAFVFPDVYMDEEMHVSLNGQAVPSLSISEYYLRLLKEDGDDDVHAYLREMYEQANMLLQNIESRKRTIIKCAEAVIAHQSAFFASRGARHPVPLTREQLAEGIGLSASTVSRALSGKYLQCPFGIYPFDYFFPEQVGGSDGTSGEIKRMIAAMVAAEDKKKPLSDQRIAEELKSNGHDISRRAVAKYRTEMNIPSTYSRKE